jgi:HAD superfamily hydrolase (TIGR01509 family)
VVTTSRALIFDCDGVLSDTEEFGHLPAFNQAFAEFSLPIHWSTLDYAEKVQIGGGKERLAASLTPELLTEAGLPGDPEAVQNLVADLHRRKTKIYTDLISTGTLPPRPGVRRLIKEAVTAGWTVAVASTSAEVSVRAVLRSAVGETLERSIPVFAGDIVKLKKPAPDIYVHALHALHLDPSQVLVIEDSENGLNAARGAGLRTLVTVSSYTAKENFRHAQLVLSSLGDPPPGPQTRVLADRYGIAPGPFVTLTAMESIITIPKLALEAS